MTQDSCIRISESAPAAPEYQKAMKSDHWLNGAVWLLLLGSLLSNGTWAGDHDIDTLRRQLAEQHQLILQQRAMLESQQRQLDAFNERLEAMATAPPESEAQTAASSTAQIIPANQDTDARPDLIERDSIGDLNSAAMQAGDFPGSFRIPGSRDISLRIGGFIKTVAIEDSNAEQIGAAFIPANLGTRRADDGGDFSIDSTLTRQFFEARAPTARGGQLRGYTEWDLNKNNSGTLDVNIRHAYGSWTNSAGTLIAGQTWSTMMDVKVIPLALTEPTVSGVIYQRQPIVRWSQPVSAGFNIHAAIEDPNSSDIFSEDNLPELDNTRVPDSILGVEFSREGLGHLRLTGLLRDIKATLPDGGRQDEWAYGLALTGSLRLLEHDVLKFSTVYGEGLGRYLLGIVPSAGGAINPATDNLSLFDSWGGMVAYEHQWNPKFRSAAFGGYAKADGADWLPDDSFESSTYASVNLLWQALPYLTLGMEYAYGQRENRDGSDIDNNRVVVGFQFY